MSEQPEALRLADALEVRGVLGAVAWKAADELRRLHAEVEEQCRLNGMGSEREAKLMAENKALRAALTFIGDHDLSGADMTVAGHMAHAFVGKARAAIDAAKEKT